MSAHRHPILIILGLALIALACGRSELDQPVGGDTASGGGGSSGGVGGTGTGGRGGGRGAAGRGGGAQPIPCGQTTCTTGSQTCCVQTTGAVCIDSRTTCQGGLSVSCVDGSSCGTGQVCCLTLLTSATACTPVLACVAGLNAVLCANDAQCPFTAPSCCQIAGIGLCRPQACP